MSYVEPTLVSHDLKLAELRKDLTELHKTVDDLKSELARVDSDVDELQEGNQIMSEEIEYMQQKKRVAEKLAKIEQAERAKEKLAPPTNWRLPEELLGLMREDVKALLNGNTKVWTSAFLRIMVNLANTMEPEYDDEVDAGVRQAVQDRLRKGTVYFEIVCEELEEAKAENERLRKLLEAAAVWEEENEKETTQMLEKEMVAGLAEIEQAERAKQAELKEQFEAVQAQNQKLQAELDSLRNFRPGNTNNWLW